MEGDARDPLGGKVEGALETETADGRANPDGAETGARDADRDAAEISDDLEQARAEVGALNERHLRLAAEFDNYRKRTERERAETWTRSQADLAAMLLDTLDDLQRVAHLDPAATATAAVVEGVTLVERKVFETLEREGLVQIGEPGERFDPEIHEAIAVIPAPRAEDAGRVAAVAAPGYTFGAQLLRPARVQVRLVRKEQRPAEAALDEAAFEAEHHGCVESSR